VPAFLHNTGQLLLGSRFFRTWYIFSLSVIIVSLPFSKVGISIGQMMIAGGWVMERFSYRQFFDYLNSKSGFLAFLTFIPLAIFLILVAILQGFRQFFSRKAAMIFSSIFILHLAGLIFTTDFDYALKDLRTKLPLLLLPLLIATSEPFDRKGFYYLLVLFAATVLCRTLYNGFLILHDQFIDIREVSRNVSHIILSLLIVLSICSLIYLSFRNSCFPFWLRWIFRLTAGWFLFYLFYSQSFTGISILVILFLLFLLLHIIHTRNNWLRAGLILAILTASTTLVLSLRSVVNDYYRVNPVDFKRLDKVSSKGNQYLNDSLSRLTENGNYLWIYVQMEEMREVWNKRSTIPFDSLNKKKEVCAFTVIRFLSSKGWRKDGDAVERLTEAEISAIEKGVPNYLFIGNLSLRARIYEFLSGFDTYRETGNPTGSTVMQRVEFWKASLGIIREHWLTGVGTGDMNIAFERQYERMQTKLAPDQRWRSHNQFLSILVGFGIPGLAWFLFVIFYPLYLRGYRHDFFMNLFLLIALLSMLTEDTIESQTGVTFFAFFYTLFLFARRREDRLFK